MITRTQIKTAILEAEKIAKPGSVLDNLTVRIPVGTLRMLIEAAKVAQYQPVSQNHNEFDVQYKLYER